MDESTSLTTQSARPGLGPWLLSKGQLLGPGLAVATGLAVVSWLLAKAEAAVFSYQLLEPLVLALLLGMAIRVVWRPPAVIAPGLAFAGKQVLEVAIILLGASLDLGTIADAGTQLVAAVLLTVTVGICAGTFLGRRAGLALKQAILVAVGNAICGNSAIAAVAPAIRAKKQEVASAIALTAVVGVGVVLFLPVLVPLLGLSHYQYGVLAGLTVYAVPQVLAATFPVSVESGQIATVVKLTRVLLLGPVVAIFAFLFRHEQATQTKFSLQKFLPWFVLGFALCAIVRTASIIPVGTGTRAQDLSRLLTIVAMAGLGLDVDVHAVRSSGLRILIVVLSLLTVLILLALVNIHVLHING